MLGSERMRKDGLAAHVTVGVMDCVVVSVKVFELDFDSFEVMLRFIDRVLTDLVAVGVWLHEGTFDVETVIVRGASLSDRAADTEDDVISDGEADKVNEEEAVIDKVNEEEAGAEAEALVDEANHDEEPVIDCRGVSLYDVLDVRDDEMIVLRDMVDDVEISAVPSAVKDIVLDA